MTSSAALRLCATPDCGHDARPGRSFCRKCEKRKERGQPLDAPEQEKLSPFEAFERACLDVGLVDTDADSDAEFNRAMDRARKAAQRYMRSLGWTPPAEGVGRGGEASPRGSEQRNRSAKEASTWPRPSLREGPVGQPARDADVVPRDAREGGRARAGGDRAARRADAPEEEPADREGRVGGDSRSRRPEAVRDRTDKARGGR